MSQEEIELCAAGGKPHCEQCWQGFKPRWWSLPPKAVGFGPVLRDAWRHYCSAECFLASPAAARARKAGELQGERRRRRSQLQERPCEICGSKFQPSGYNLAQETVCSEKCREKKYRIKHAHELTCEECGSLFVHYIKAPRKRCYECRPAMRYKHPDGRRLRLCSRCKSYFEPAEHSHLCGQCRAEVYPMGDR